MTYGFGYAHKGLNTNISSKRVIISKLIIYLPFVALALGFNKELVGSVFNIIHLGKLDQLGQIGLIRAIEKIIRAIEKIKPTGWIGTFISMLFFE